MSLHRKKGRENEKDILKLPSRDISLSPDILHTLPTAIFSKVGLGCDTEHALKSVNEENSYEAI